jgi:Sulfite exporter TauE/SafE
MLRNCAVDPEQSSWLTLMIRRLKSPWIGLGIGSLSALAGVGGASLTVPYLLLGKVDMRRAVAVSSAVGLAIAAAGALSFGFAVGADTVETDKTLVGLVCWPAALTIAFSAIFMAPRGVAASHKLPVQHLKRAFGGVLLAVCATTLIKLAVPAPQSGSRRIGSRPGRCVTLGRGIRYRALLLMHGVVRTWPESAQFTDKGTASLGLSSNVELLPPHRPSL